jgi:hypothetical protein
MIAMSRILRQMLADGAVVDKIRGSGHRGQGPRYKMQGNMRAYDRDRA